MKSLADPIKFKTQTNLNISQIPKMIVQSDLLINWDQVAKQMLISHMFQH